MRILVESDVVKDKELRFRPEAGGIRNTCAFEIVGRFASDAPGISGVLFPSQWIKNVANQNEGGQLAERVHKCGVRLRHDQHVRLIDRLPSPDAGTIEPKPIFEHLFGEVSHGDRRML